MAGDVITGFEGVSLDDLRAYTTEPGKCEPGDKVMVQRDGTEVTRKPNFPHDNLNQPRRPKPVTAPPRRISNS